MKKDQTLAGLTATLKTTNELVQMANSIQMAGAELHAMHYKEILESLRIAQDSQAARAARAARPPSPPPP